jgi:hypothetical protein
MAYNALLQTISGRNSVPFTAPFTAPFPAPAANLPGSITPLTSATTSTITSASNYEYMPFLKQSDYPQVRFWDKSSFLNALAGKNATTFALLPNTAKIETTDYLEDENSTPLTEQRRGAIYSHARRFWNTYLQKSGRFPSTYSALDLDTLGHFRSEMERHFLELRLCDNHWKADEIWIRNYHSWRSSAERQPGMVKAEVCDNSDPVAKKEKPRPRKRKRKRTITISDTVSSPPVSSNTLESDTVTSVAPSGSRRLPAASGPPLKASSRGPLTVHLPTDNQISYLPENPDTLVALAQLGEDNETLSAVYNTVLSPPVSNNSLESDTVMSVAPYDSRLLTAASGPPLEASSKGPLTTQLPTDNPISQLSDTLAQLSTDNETLSVAHDTVLSPPPFNNTLALDTVMSVAPDDSRRLPAASCPPLETLSHVSPTTQLHTDDQISHFSDTLVQHSADNETLSAALGLSLLVQPVNGKSRQSHCSLD